jgi:hypothetical protein
MTGPRDFDKVPIENRIARAVADSLLSQKGYDPKEVYTFLGALEGHPEVTNFTVESIAPTVFMPVVKAEYHGDLPWNEENGHYVASDEFHATARSIFKSVAKHTGHTIEKPHAVVHPDYEVQHDYCRADVKVGDKSLTMIIIPAE